MRLLHTADLHLGFRQYERSTRTGINQREADIASTFVRVVDQAIAIAPDVLVIAGDVFHRVNPGNIALHFACGELQRLTRALPGTAVVVIAGNHDAPRASESGCALRLFQYVGVHVVLAPQRLALPGLSILCVPDGPGVQRPAFEPDAAAPRNVLLLHGKVAGAPKYGTEPPLTHDALGIARWDYVALGDYHVCHQVAPNAWYSGSIDFTSSDPWGELRTGQPKGMLEIDLETGARTFHPIAPSRPLVDLPVIEAERLSPAEVDAALRANLEGAPIAGAIVRQVVRDLDRVVAKRLDRAALKQLKRAAWHYHFDERRPETVRVRTTGTSSQRRESLADLIARHFATSPMAPDVDRAEVTALGLRYLAQAEQLSQQSETIIASEPTDPHEEAA